MKNITDSRLIKTTENNDISFNTLFFKKFQAEITLNDQNKSFKGNLYIIKDSVIIVSVLPLMGIEIFRLKFVLDTIFILDRTKKKINVVNYDYLWDKFFVDIDFSTVQNILLDQFFCYPPAENDKNCIKKYKHYIRNDQYSLQSIKNGRYSRISKKNNRRDIVYHEFDIAPDIFKITGTYINDFDSNTQIKISYKDFVEIKDYVFPTSFVIKGQRGGNAFSIKITFKDIELDGLSKISFKHSDKYKFEYIQK